MSQESEGGRKEEEGCHTLFSAAARTTPTPSGHMPFLLSLYPLAKVGEACTCALAVKCLATRNAAVDTLLFDLLSQPRKFYCFVSFQTKAPHTLLLPTLLLPGSSSYFLFWGLTVVVKKSRALGVRGAVAYARHAHDHASRS